MKQDPEEHFNIGICGLGTVGCGTFHLLQRKQAELTRRLGKRLRLTHVASRRRHPDCDITGMKFSTDVFDVANDPEVDIVVELIGGSDPALDLILRAIENGKHVVTANKALIAVHGNTIFEAAHRKGVVVAYESAVAGGIPIVKALREGLAANSIHWLAGIINGTGNYILTEMEENKRPFAEVLQEAQDLGYAEADPTFDVEGIDAAHKLTILASNAFGIALQFDRVYTEGIGHITTADVTYADELGYRIKHLGITRLTELGIELRVHPTLISKQRLIANVNGVMNAVVVKGDSVGSTLYYGAGAGAEATASSVVADIIDIVRGTYSVETSSVEPGADQESEGLPMPVLKRGGHMPSLAFDSLRDDLPILDIEDIETAYYLRIAAYDRIGVMAHLSQVMMEHGINIEAVIQKEPDSDDPELAVVPIIMLTSRVRESDMNRAIAVIEGLKGIAGRIMRIRVEQFDDEDE